MWCTPFRFRSPLPPLRRLQRPQQRLNSDSAAAGEHPIDATPALNAVVGREIAQQSLSDGAFVAQWKRGEVAHGCLRLQWPALASLASAVGRAALGHSVGSSLLYSRS